jgi:hypothetical protein
VPSGGRFDHPAASAPWTRVAGRASSPSRSTDNRVASGRPSGDHGSPRVPADVLLEARLTGLRSRPRRDGAAGPTPAWQPAGPPVGRIRGAVRRTRFDGAVKHPSGDPPGTLAAVRDRRSVARLRGVCRSPASRRSHGWPHATSDPSTRPLRRGLPIAHPRTRRRPRGPVSPAVRAARVEAPTTAPQAGDRAAITDRRECSGRVAGGAVDRAAEPAKARRGRGAGAAVSSNRVGRRALGNRPSGGAYASVRMATSGGQLRRTGRKTVPRPRVT